MELVENRNEQRYLVIAGKYWNSIEWCCLREQERGKDMQRKVWGILSSRLNLQMGVVQVKGESQTESGADSEPLIKTQSSKRYTKLCVTMTAESLPEEAPKNFRKNGTSSMRWSNGMISLTPGGWCNCWGSSNGKEKPKSLRKKGKRSSRNYKHGAYDWCIYSCIWLPIVSLWNR